LDLRLYAAGSDRHDPIPAINATIDGLTFRADQQLGGMEDPGARDTPSRRPATDSKALEGAS
jgi:hypothetical protein